MPKVKLNSALSAVSGAMDGWVYKHYKNDKRGLVLSRAPDMSRVKPSTAQLARREAMRKAGEFHRKVLSDPALLKKYKKLAKEKGINLSAATMGAALKSK